MRIEQPPVLTSDQITINSDLNMGGLYQVKNLAAPASGEALRKGNKDIANAEVSDSAAIAGSKLNLALYITNAMISASAAIVRSKLNFGDGLVNADIAAAAAIALSKLASTPASLTISETEAYSGNAPTSWTDLDLSSIVGANPTLVILKITNTNTTAMTRVAVRKNGDTDEFFHTIANARGSALAATEESSAVHLVLIVATDDNGVIEWCAQGAGGATVDVIGYIK